MDIDLKGKHLVIAVPAYDGKVPAKWMEEFFSLSRLSISYGFTVSLSYQIHGALIANNRNIAVAEFLETTGTHLLFIDADILFSAEDIIKMMAYTDLPDETYEIIHAAYPLKSDTPQFHVEVGKELEETKYGLWRSYAAGCGFVMMKRNVLEAMCEKYTELFYRNRFLDKTMYALFDQMIVNPREGGDPIYLGEDVSFFRRWKDMGGEMWCDPQIRLKHIGTKTYDASLKDLMNSIKE